MQFVWAVIGGIVGLVIGAIVGGEATSLAMMVAGAIVGVLHARQSALTERVKRAETQLADLWSTRALGGADPAPESRAGIAPRLRTEPSIPAASAEVAVADAPTIDLGAVAVAPPAPAAARNPAPASRPRPAMSMAQETTVDRAVAAIKGWFTEGNVPVKVGMLVLFAGIAALLKLAADEGWLSVPIEFRLIGVAHVAIAALVFGWRQRVHRRGFSLSLQGGAIGVMLLTVYAAFRVYALLSPATAFGLMVALIIGIGVLAVVQDALALAVLGLFAGFAAPILLSTGSGNHVVLFSYYALLNLAIFAIAWVRSWRLLELLGFLSTFAIATIWGVLRYQPELQASTLPFLLLFFSIYLVIPILHAVRNPAEHGDRIDGTLVFGNPLISFLLLSALLIDQETTLALAALALGIGYLILSVLLIRRVRLLGESLAILAIVFMTLAVPIGLSALATSCIFAIEGAALVWLGTRQRRQLPQWSGWLLQGFAGFAYAFIDSDVREGALMFANGTFLGAMLIALAGLTSALLHRNAGSRVAATILYAWGLLWWFAASISEIEHFITAPYRIEAMIVAFAASAWLLAEADRRLREIALAAVAAAVLWLVLPMIVLMPDRSPALGAWSFGAMVVFAVAGWRSLLCLRDGNPRALAGAHLAWLWVWTAFAAVVLHTLASTQGFAEGWRMAAIGLPIAAMLLLSVKAPNAIAQPVANAMPGHRAAWMLSLVGALAIGFAVSLFQSGATLPLPFVPVLNPLELVQLAALLAFSMWSKDRDAPAVFARVRPLLLAGAGFAFVTSATLRASHHLGGLPWNEALITSSLSQTSLSVVWSLLGVVGWVIGSRRGNRALWMAAAVLMAIVLAKLLLVDRQHLGNIFGVASFIAYGLLCTLIGYLAPAPPRQGEPTVERSA